MYQSWDRGFTVTTVGETGYGRLQGSEEGSSFHCSLNTERIGRRHTAHNSFFVEVLMNLQQNKKKLERVAEQVHARVLWYG
jgi:hypothetical protein